MRPDHLDFAAMRLFVALDPPEDIKQRLLLAQGGVSGARWQSADQLHLTLRFLGELDRHQAADAAAALAGVHHPRFSLSLAGAGVFGKPTRPEALWIGVTPEAAVKALHNKVDQALARVGIAPETRQFKPHITIARLNGRTGPLGGFMTDQGGISGPPFPVDDFCLYESTLSRDGAVYTILERYPLGSA
ncbi:RNA 2',3'-cyclic phosphodiesterase [Parapedomonas caeni]